MILSGEVDERMEQNKILKKNNFIYCITLVLYNYASLTLITGSIIQSFMIESGISEQRVATFVSILQVVQAVIMIFCSGLIDNLKNVIKVSALLQLFTFPLFGVLVLFCYFNEVPVDLKYWTIMIVGIAVNMLISMCTILAYKLPFHIMDMKSYGKLIAFSGAAGGLCSMGLSLLMTFTLARWDYFTVMGMIFGVGGILTIVVSLYMLRLKEVGTLPPKNENAPKKNMLLYRPFYILLIPNLMRGIGYGIISLAVMIGYYYDILDSTTSSYLLVISNLASVAGNYFFGLFAKNEGKKEGKLLLVSTTCMFLLFPFMLVGKNVWIFLGVYCLILFLRLFMDNAIPVMVFRIVDYDTVGQYSAWRMMVHTLGIAIAGFICIPMLELFGGVLTLTLTGAMLLICAIAYYVVEKQK